VTATFKKQREDTLMTLVHSGLPDTDGGRGARKVGTIFWKFFASNLETVPVRTTARMTLIRANSY